MENQISKPKVLIVDDERLNLNLLATLLKSDCKVIAAKSGEQAIERASIMSPDLILLDVVMPGMNGRELTDNLQVRYPDIKTLYMSGYTADVIADRGVLEKEVHFIQKPFSVKDLGFSVRETLKTP